MLRSPAPHLGGLVLKMQAPLFLLLFLGQVLELQPLGLLQSERFVQDLREERYENFHDVAARGHGGGGGVFVLCAHGQGG